MLTDELRRTIAGVHGERGIEWMEDFEALTAFCESNWQLTLLPPYELSYHFVAPVMLRNGTEAVLKLGVPCREMRTEIAALRLYDGRGAVRLLDADPVRGILLLERLKPGHTLHAVQDDEEAVRIAARVMKAIARPAPIAHPATGGPQFPSTADWAAGFKRLRARYEGGTGPLPEARVGEAELWFAELNGSISRPILLHGDLHHGNMLSAEREPWLAIDPKGLIGEAEYGVIQFLLNNLPERDYRPLIERRIRQFAEELQLSERRIRQWAFCHALLSAWWTLEDNSPGFEEALQAALVIRELQ